MTRCRHVIMTSQNVIKTSRCGDDKSKFDISSCHVVLTRCFEEISTFQHDILPCYVEISFYHHDFIKHIANMTTSQNFVMASQLLLKTTGKIET